MIKTITARRGFIGMAAALTLLAGGAAGGVALADNAAIKANAPHARASAKINADGTREQSQGIKSVTKPSTGVTCVTFDDEQKIKVERSTPVATLVGDRSQFLESSIAIDTGPNSACGAGALTVVTGYNNPSTMFDMPFFLLVP